MHRHSKRKSTAHGLSKGCETMTDELKLKQEVNGVGRNDELSLDHEGVIVNETGLCTMCGKTSVCKCERCGDFYCSPLCQRNDWPNHRFICLPMPRLVKVGQLLINENGDKDKVVPNLKVEANRPCKARQLGNNPLAIPLPKSGSCVVLTGFTSSNRCFIRSANPTTTKEYQEILKKIDNFGKNSNGLSGTPKANSFAIAQKDDKWCRVKILAVRPDNIRIQFVDDGKIGIRKLKDLRTISGAMSGLPCFVNMVQLQSITTFSTNSKLLNELNQYVGKEYKIQFIDEAAGMVELYHWRSNTLLNSEVLKLCRDFKDNDVVSNSSSLSYNDVDIAKNEATLKANGDTIGTENKTVSTASAKEDLKCDNDAKAKSSETSTGSVIKKSVPPLPRQIQIQKPCLEPPFETIPFAENDRDFTVYVVDSSYANRGYIGCLLEKYADNLTSITNFLKQYDANGQSYKPKMNEYCLAQFDNEWYRAKVIEVLGEDKYLVVYIDFTNELQLTSKSLRRYPMSLTLPCCTSLCVIDGLPEEFSDELIDFMEKKFEGFQKMKIDRVKIVEDTTIIESKELIKMLHDAKLI